MNLMIRVLCTLLLSCSIANATLVLAAPDEFSSSQSPEWMTLEDQLINTSEKDIVIYWGGIGGYVYMLYEFIHAARVAHSQGKYITIVLVDDAYSCHAMAACYVDQVKGNEQYVLMFHNIAGQGNTPLSDPDTRQEIATLLQPCVSKGILLPTDVQRIQTLTEVWVYKRNNQYIRTYKFDRRVR